MENQEQDVHEEKKGNLNILKWERAGRKKKKKRKKGKSKLQGEVMG